MSYWFDVDKDDIELSDDGKTLNVRIDDHNHDWGNMYAQLPIDRVRELVAPSGWRDVREDLPEDGVVVLDQNFDKVHFYRKPKYDHTSPNCWFIKYEDGDVVATEHVTHWMPLPAPPKEG
jgi:hypothetical protein